jgi:hypothetical protein
MSAWSACAEGVRRVARSWNVVLILWLVSVLFSVPLGLGVRRDIERQLGSSLQANAQIAGATYDWLSEFGDQATGATSTFGPAVIGFAAVVDNLSAFLEWDLRPVVVSAMGIAYALLWLFLAGGLIDRFARNRATRTHAFFQVSGGYFFRLLRLSAISTLIYAAIILHAHHWLLDDTFDRLTDNLDTERTAFFIRIGLYGAFVGLLAIVNLWFDYAKIRLVVEDRGSVLGALRAAARFVTRSGSGTFVLYLVDTALFGAVLLIYAVVAPGASSTWLAFVVGQLYIAARIAVKLVFWASEIAWFQGRLAHAGYAAAPRPVWPDSAAAEAIGQG